MQLVNSKTKKLIPLTIAGGIIASANVFSYNAIEQSKINSFVSSPTLENFLQQTNKNTYSGFYQKLKFQEHLNEWKSNTLFMSFADEIVNEENFIAIISMGLSAVPFIIEEISKKPSTLVWALNRIFNKSISNNPNTTIEEACKLWVKALS